MVNFEEMVKTIYRINNGIELDLEKNENLYISNELRSVHYMGSQYKLMELFKHEYYDFHFCINDTAYDVFMYQKEDINMEHLLQLIFCNNYIQIFSFKEGEYDRRKLVAEFSVFDSIYSFYDSSVIIIEHKRDSKQYQELFL